ncbi:MerR family transcriptional regulator [[Clostridium] innocuum]|nr:MerR family transcriptional regulator [[Clostridium] innocuum]MCR0579140.1 MerR family transcriptional regulator [[Clostridium] innocuum]
MRIQEIADITGLSKKAINLYEKKGMLQVFRDDSGYRCYTQEHVRILMQIKILRRMDVSLADISHLLQEKNLQLLDTQKEQLEKKLAQCELQNFYMQRIAELLEENDTELLQSVDQEMEEAWEDVQEPQTNKRSVSSFIVVEVMLATFLLDNENMLYVVIGVVLLVHVFYVIGKASPYLESPLDYLLYIGGRKVRSLFDERRKHDETDCSE